MLCSANHARSSVNKAKDKAWKEALEEGYTPAQIAKYQSEERARRAGKTTEAEISEFLADDPKYVADLSRVKLLEELEDKVDTLLLRVAFF